MRDKGKSQRPYARFLWKFCDLRSWDYVCHTFGIFGVGYDRNVVVLRTPGVCALAATQTLKHADLPFGTKWDIAQTNRLKLPQQYSCAWLLQRERR